MIAASSFNGSLGLWDTATGKRLGRIDGEGNPVQALVFSADGKTLIVARQNLKQKGVVLAYSIPDCREIRSYELVHDYPIRVAPSPDGKMLASWGSVTFRDANDPAATEKLSRTVQLWDAAGGKEVRRIETDRGAVESAVFSPDGKTLALAAGVGTVQFWDPAAGALLRTIQGRRSYNLSLTFAPDGKTLYAAGGDGKIQAWEVESGRRLSLAEGPPGRLSSVAFPRGGKLLACSQDGVRAVVWEAAAGKTVAPPAGHAASVGAVVFAPDGKTLWSAGADGALLRWDAATGKVLRRQQMEFTDDSDRLRIKHHRSLFLFSPDARYLLSGGYPNHGVLDLRETADAGEVFRFASPWLPDYFHSFPVAFSADGSLLAAAERAGQSTDGAVHLWDAATGRERFALKGGKGEPSGLAISPDGKTVALATLAVPPSRLRQSPHAEVWAWSLGDNQGPRSLKKLIPEEGEMWEGSDLLSLAYSPDGRVMAATDRSGRLEVWDASTGTDRWRKAPVIVNDFLAVPVAFSPDGRLLAAASHDPQSREGKIRLWEVASGMVRREFTGRFGPVTSLAFSPDGATLATGCQDATILQWDVDGTRIGNADLIKSLKSDALDASWADLASADAAAAARAVVRLAAAPDDAVPYLQKHVSPVKGKTVDGATLARLVADLDADDFDARGGAAGFGGGRGRRRAGAARP